MNQNVIGLLLLFAFQAFQRLQCFPDRFIPFPSACAYGKEEKACVLGMPVKDTIKLTDENGKIRESPRRDLVWQAQTPQAFAAELLFPAFEKLMQHSTEGITDDAMVVEQEMGIASVMVKGGYENIKITTPEDLLVAESFLAEK